MPDELSRRNPDEDLILPMGVGAGIIGGAILTALTSWIFAVLMGGIMMLLVGMRLGERFKR